MAPEYLKNLTTILSDTPKEVLHTYLLWKQIQAYGPYIEADAVAPLRQFSNELQGKVKSPDTLQTSALTICRIPIRLPNDGEPALNTSTVDLAGS